jgi:hypothetical protein
MEDPPTRSGLVLTYVIALTVLVAATFGAGALLGFSAWAASECLPSGHPLASSGSVTAGVLVLGAVLVSYCAGCAAYLWSVGAAAVHSRVWLAIALVMLGLVVWVGATAKIQPNC